MKVIIPLAGFGARLRPHTYTKPKPLLNVAGKPMLAHILDALAPLDVEEMVFIVGHLGAQIEQYVSSHYHFTAHFVEQKELKGQAHALYLAREHLTGPILIIFVDTIFEADLQHLPTDCDGVLYVKEVPDPRRFQKTDSVAVCPAPELEERRLMAPQPSRVVLSSTRFAWASAWWYSTTSRRASGARY